MKTISVAIPESDYEIYRRAAQVQHRSTAQLIREAVAYFRERVLTERDRELSLDEAAELLSVSRSYCLKLLEEGAIPSRVTGAEHRIPLDDLLAYKRRDLARRQRILAELTAEAQEMGLDY